MKNYKVYVHKQGIENIEFVQIIQSRGYAYMKSFWILNENGKFIDVAPLSTQDYLDEYELL